jgi:hypothetical protein
MTSFKFPRFGGVYQGMGRLEKAGQKGNLKAGFLDASCGK